MKLTRLAFMLFGVVILMQFNNCSPLSNKAGFDNSFLLATCDPAGTSNPFSDQFNVNCAVADHNNLAINPQGGDPAINSAQANFNVAGTCNEGGFGSNVVLWTLKYQGAMVRNSGMLYNGQSMNTECINGNFLLNIVLASIPEDNFSRTGLMDPNSGTRQPYQLEITIIGIDSLGTPHANLVFGTRVLNLNPL